MVSNLRDTLSNPLLRAGFLRWLERHTKSDDLEGFDVEGELDLQLTPSEMKERLRSRFPEMFRDEEEPRIKMIVFIPSLIPLSLKDTAYKPDGKAEVVKKILYTGPD